MNTGTKIYDQSSKWLLFIFLLYLSLIVSLLLGENSTGGAIIDYTNQKKVELEIQNAKKTFKKYQWPVVDVTRKSVEETAASIIKIYEIKRENG